MCVFFCIWILFRFCLFGCLSVCKYVWMCVRMCIFSYIFAFQWRDPSLSHVPCPLSLVPCPLSLSLVPVPCPRSTINDQRSMINDHWSMIIDHWSLIIDIIDHWSLIIYHWLSFIIYHFHESFLKYISSGWLVEAGGSGCLAPQQGRGVWGAEPPISHRSSDLSKCIFDQFGDHYWSIWGPFLINFGARKT